MHVFVWRCLVCPATCEPVTLTVNFPAAPPLILHSNLRLNIVDCVQMCMRVCSKLKNRCIGDSHLFSISVLAAYLSLSLCLPFHCLSYAHVCRPAPTGPMGSIGVHWIACMAAVAPHAASNTRSAASFASQWRLLTRASFSRASRRLFKYCTNFKPFIWIFAEELKWATDQQLCEKVTSGSSGNSEMSAFAPSFLCRTTHVHGVFNKRFSSVDLLVHLCTYWSVYVNVPSWKCRWFIWQMGILNVVPNILNNQDKRNILPAVLVGEIVFDCNGICRLMQVITLKHKHWYTSGQIQRSHFVF